MPGESITELAASIAKNTGIINDYLTSKNLPLPSFDVDAPSKSQIPLDAPEVELARMAVIDDTLKLRALVLGPRQYLMDFMHNDLISMQFIHRFKIAEAVPIHGEVSFSEVARKTGLDELNVRRFLRHAMTNRLFSEPCKGFVKHTAASRLLLEDEPLSAWVGCNGDEMWQSSSQTVNALVKFKGSQEPNETGFALANNTDKAAFAFLATEPVRARRFGNAMKNFVDGPGYDLKFLVQGFDWASLGCATIVDVGGSTGFASIRLAQEFPHLTVINQDLEVVIKGAEGSVPAEVKDRFKLMPYDFIQQQQPVKDADVYLFRWVFHDWSDKYCKIILDNLIPALKPGAHVLLMDAILPEPGTVPHHIERRLRSMDITMLELQNARERDADEWAAVFTTADPRFTVKRITTPSGSRLSFIDAIWEPHKKV